MFNDIMEKITGFDKWCQGWKDWHMNGKGRPDCKTCEGTGIAYHPNGEDDYYKEECSCIK